MVTPQIFHFKDGFKKFKLWSELLTCELTVDNLTFKRTDIYLYTFKELYKFETFLSHY